MKAIRLLPALLCVLAATAQENFFPMGVWYGGGKARAPMLEGNPAAHRDRWRRDVQAIRSLGFNTLRCWIDWASAEPAEGEYRFETVETLLDLAHEAGLKVVIQVYMDSAPSWVGRKYPDALFVSSNGQAITPESSPGYCLDHAAVQKADARFYERLARQVGRHPAFLGWDLWSEPHVINWANPTYIPNPEFCFCPHTKRRFRQWLLTKYGNIGELNRAWYRRYQSWDEVEPNRLSTILSYTDYVDWKMFIQDKLAQDLRSRYEAVKRGAPRAVATSHAAGVGLFSSPHYWEGQSDDWKMAAQVDYYGTSFYPKHSAFVDREVAWRGALLDFARSFGYSGGRNGFWIGELQGGFGTIALNVSPTVTPRDLRIWTWSALSRGAKGIHTYAWYPMSSGYESGGFGLIELDGTITARAREAGAVARLVDQNQKLLLSARPAPAEVAVIYNPLSHFVGGRQRAAAYGGPQGEVAGIERDSLLGIYRALFPLNAPLDYVHMEFATPQQLRQYKLLYLPYPLMLPEKAGQLLRDYVASGGTLVAEARPGWNNERGYASDIIPGMGLHELFGARETAIQTAPKGRTALTFQPGSLPGISAALTLPGRWYEESLAPLREGARVVAAFASGDPAAVTSTYGKGRTLLVGSYLSAAYQTDPQAGTAFFFRSLLDWAGVRWPVTADEELEVRVLHAGPERLLIVFHHGEQAGRKRFHWQGDAPSYLVTDLATQQEVQTAQEDGRLVFEAMLEPGAVWVLRLTPR